MTITEFLEARIAEDEAAAREALPEQDTVYGAAGFFDPARVLAECSAKRAIIAKIPRGTDPYDPGGFTSAHTIHALAAVYADHPDYQQEWAIGN